MSSDGASITPAPAPAPANTPYTLLKPEEFRGLPTVTWRVKNLLPCTGVAFIYGASNTGKTFLALDLAAAIADGRPWFGKKCNGAPVVYLALEGAMIRMRTAAWETHHKRPLPAVFRMMIGQPFGLVNRYDVNGLAERIREEVGLGAVVIVDTMHRATIGLDENSAQEMGQAIEAAEDLSRLVQGLVILVHHAGKNADHGMRGSSAMFAAAETVIKVTGKVNPHAWQAEKLKDAESFGECLFKLDSVDVGEDADGDPITSCAVVWDQAAEALEREEYRGKGKNQRLVLDVIRHEIEKGPPHCAPEGVPDGVRVIPREVAICFGSIELESAGAESGRGKERATAAINALIKSGTLLTAGGTGRKAVVWVP